MSVSDSLGRRIGKSVAGAVLAVHAVIFLLCYGIYFVAGLFWPTLFDCESDLPTVPDVLLFMLLGLVGVVVSVVLSLRLTKRLVAPLNSVAASLHRLAGGDLEVRADAGDLPRGEAWTLVDDFNHMAERLQRAMTERTLWNAAIAHELRTPVTILRGRLSGFADGVFAPTEEAFRKLLTQVDGLARLIEDLRLLSLFESHQLRLDCRHVNLDQEVRTMGDIYEPLLRKSGLRLKVLVDDVPVWCDPIRIRQALAALLDNALKYSRQGELWVSCTVMDRNCRLRVEDEGPGLPEESRQQVFRAFWQDGTVSSKVSSGSGLGLSVVKAIAMAHGGDARCHVNARGGSTFEIEWPRESPSGAPHASSPC